MATYYLVRRGGIQLEKCDTESEAVTKAIEEANDNVDIPFNVVKVTEIGKAIAKSATFTAVELDETPELS